MDEQAKKGATKEPPNDAQRLGFRALLVDDHADTTELFRVLFEKKGAEVVVARSVAAAVRAAQAGPFDILITDINLPDGTGLELLAEVRRLRPIIPAIAITGLGGEDDARRCREAGFDEHFAKPANFQKVFDAVRRLLANVQRAKSPTD